MMYVLGLHTVHEKLIEIITIISDIIMKEKMN